MDIDTILQATIYMLPMFIWGWCCRSFLGSNIFGLLINCLALMVGIVIGSYLVG